jgi:hypothetical protein
MENIEAPRPKPPMVIGPTTPDSQRHDVRQLSPYELRRVERMQRCAPAIVEHAHDIGVELAYLGIAGLFNETRLYKGPKSNWTLGPVDEDEPAVVPRAQQLILKRLVEARVAPFLTYVAHEVDRSQSDHLLADVGQQGSSVVSHEQAALLNGPVPDHAGALEVAARLDQHSTTVLAAIRKGAPIAAGALLGVLAAPFLLAGAVVASLATFDPILIGAVPILRADVGEPAAFFELTRWDW